MEISKSENISKIPAHNISASKELTREPSINEIDAFGKDQISIAESKFTDKKKEAQETCDCIISKGEEIAREVLKKDTHKVIAKGHKRRLSVLTAGSDHFESLWTRDACFGSIGILEPGKHAPQVKGSLQAIFDRMSPLGVLPRCEGEFAPTLMVAASALHIKIPELNRLNIVSYKNDLNVYQFDANALPIIVAEEYVKSTGDVNFIKHNYSKLTAVANWLEEMDNARMEGKLINQPPSGDWKDVTRRSGVVAYTNALTYQAQKSMAQIDRLMENNEKAEHREAFAAKLKEDFNKRLWDEKHGYYKDDENTDIFSPDGNILAVIFGLADEKQSASIFKKFEEVDKVEPLPYQATEKEYPDSYIPFWLKLGGMRNYQSKMVWTWLGSTLAVAAARSGKVELAKKVLARVAKKAVDDGTFYEIHTPGKNPEPVHTWAYHSEPDFLWGAGTYLWAVREIRQAEGKNMR